MRAILAPFAIVVDILLLVAFVHALPWLLSAAMVLGGIALAGWVVFIAVRAALRAAL